MPSVRIPTPLRRLTDGAAQVSVDGADLRAVVANLTTVHPGLRVRLLDDDGNLQRFVNVFVHDQDIRVLDGLDTTVTDGDTIVIVPAVAGG